MTTDDVSRDQVQQRLTAVRIALQARARPQPSARHTPRPLPPESYDLTARIFRGLFTDFDLHDTDGGYVAVPKGTPLFTGTSLGDLARQITKAAGC